ncbi:transferrin-binding protein-like solute binding protein [Mannheimia sp. USDA-ARS-USMARC-1261]|nr:transferrin-binding protein-like solute binding protein [Mannheimia sp. USDA-ARS-USMARC-1261]
MNSAELEGHFYGSNASEIGGAYSSSDFSGTFGGKKQ